MLRIDTVVRTTTIDVVDKLLRSTTNAQLTRAENTLVQLLKSRVSCLLLFAEFWDSDTTESRKAHRFYTDATLAVALLKDAVSGIRDLMDMSTMARRDYACDQKSLLERLYFFLHFGRAQFVYLLQEPRYRNAKSKALQAEGGGETLQALKSDLSEDSTPETLPFRCAKEVQRKLELIQAALKKTLIGKRFFARTRNITRDFDLYSLLAGICAKLTAVKSWKSPGSYTGDSEVVLRHALDIKLCLCDRLTTSASQETMKIHAFEVLIATISAFEGLQRHDLLSLVFEMFSETQDLKILIDVVNMTKTCGFWEVCQNEPFAEYRTSANASEDNPGDSAEEEDVPR